MGVTHSPRSRRLHGWLPTTPSGIAVALIPFVVTIAFGVLFVLDRPLYLWSVEEDSAVEWATMAVYLAITPAALLVALRRHRGGDRLGTFAWIVLAAGFVFIAGEEVSWFQRQIGFDGPEALVVRNIQDEANLHNLLDRYALHAAYIVVGLWGLGAGRVVARLIPVARPVWLYAPSRRRWTWFLPVTGYYVWIDYIGPAVATALGPWFDEFARGPARFQEPMELLLACAFAFFVVDVVRSTAAPPRPVTHTEDAPRGSSLTPRTSSR